MSLPPNAEFFDRKTAERLWDLEQHGTRVPVYNDHFFQMSDWCRANCKGNHGNSHFSVLIDEVVYRRSIKIADGLIPNPRTTGDSNWFEAAMSDAIQQDQEHQIHLEMVRSMGFVRPSYHFWFSDRDEAMLFKMTFGGK